MFSIELGQCTYRNAVNVSCEGISLDQAKKSRCVDLIAGGAPMPREMSFALGASENWNEIYDYIRCMSKLFVSELQIDCDHTARSV